MLQSGAELVTRADEVRELVGRAGELADELPRPVDALDALTDNERRVYEALPARGGRTPDEIAVTSCIPPSDVLGPLVMLDIAGLVERQDGRWRLTRPRN